MQTQVLRAGRAEWRCPLESPEVWDIMDGANRKYFIQHQHQNTDEKNYINKKPSLNFSFEL